MEIEYNKMSGEEIEELKKKVEDNWETLKDEVLKLKEENQRLKNRMSTMAYTKVYVKKEDLGYIDKHFEKDLVSVDDLISCIEGLDSEIESQKEEYEQLEKNIKENYRPISLEEQYNIDDRWFH